MKDRYGRELGGPRNQVYSTAKTTDKNPDVPCRTCGRVITISTRDGQLVGVESDNTLHPCEVV